MAELRKISPEELKEILAVHKKWLESDGKEGKQADLHGVDLNTTDLRQATFKNTSTRLTEEELKSRGAIVTGEIQR